jgi:hypothetical protein
MADTKISALPAATALAGTEVFPLVQSGATKNRTVDQMLNDRASVITAITAPTGGGLVTVLTANSAQSIPTGATVVPLALTVSMIDENGTGNTTTGEIGIPVGAKYARFIANTRWNHGANPTATQMKIMVEGYDVNASSWTVLPGAGCVMANTAGSTIGTFHELSTVTYPLQQSPYLEYTKFRLSVTVTCTGSLSTMVNGGSYYAAFEAVFR